MMKPRISFSLLFFCVFFSLIGNSKAQEKSKKKNKAEIDKLYTQAEEYIAIEPKDYIHALPLYLKIDSLEPNSIFIKYRIGLCYLNSTENKGKAVPYLEYAAKADQSGQKEKAPDDVYFYLGKAYHLAYRLDEAIVSYEQYKALFDKNDPAYTEANRQISMCLIAKELMKNPVEATITNLGDVINSSYPEYGPVISADESVLIFTSRRPGSTGEELTTTGEYFEDIYISYKVSDQWTKPVGIGSNINTNAHEASIGLSADGQQLFMYKDDNGDGNIYVCNLIGDTWSAPQKLGSTINTKAWEPSASLSADGKTLYFVSEKKGGFGGRDIYKSKKLPDGQWGIPLNLGSAINTPYDEDAPFIHPDGKTLYFSSTGHKSMGGFDIFYSEYSDSTDIWSEPQNVGYPINSTDDDVFFVLSADAKHAYYSSVKEGGKGEKDIYLIALETKKEVPLTVMKGRIALGESLSSSIDANIVVTDNETGELVGIFKPNSKTGKYLLILPSGRNYNIAIESNGFLFHSENLSVASQTSYSEINREVKLAPIQVGASIVLKNIFFDTDKATIRKESKTELDRLYKVLSENITINIEISGHTDNIGSDSYNEKLSQARAQAVVDYLKRQGIDSKRVTAKGYGESKPIASNDTEEGRQENRRTEFKILSF